MKASRAPASLNAWAVAHAIERLLATPKMMPNLFCSINDSLFAAASGAGSHAVSGKHYRSLQMSVTHLEHTRKPCLAPAASRLSSEQHPHNIDGLRPDCFDALPMLVLGQVFLLLIHNLHHDLM